MISVHGEGMAVAKHIGGGGVEMKTSTHSSLLTREFVGNHHRFGSGGATGVARDSYFRSSEKYSVSIMWVCQRQSKMLVITWANWQARNVARGQPLRRRSGGAREVFSGTLLFEVSSITRGQQYRWIRVSSC